MKTQTSPAYNCVLLLDDNELDNFINRKTLEAVRFSDKIVVNNTAKNALDFLKSLHETGQKVQEAHPEVVFVDLNMPVMDGFQFLEAMKETYPGNFDKTRIVILTSSLHETDKQRARKISESILFLNKPLTESMLMSLARS